MTNENFIPWTTYYLRMKYAKVKADIEKIEREFKQDPRFDPDDKEFLSLCATKFYHKLPTFGKGGKINAKI